MIIDTEKLEKERQEMQKFMAAEYAKPVLQSDQIDLSNEREVREQVLQQLKIQATNGDLSAIKEYNRMYLPKNGMRSFVNFDLPSNIDKLGSREFSQILINLMKAVGSGQMDLEQFDHLSSSIKALVDITETAELQEQIEGLRDRISSGNVAGTGDVGELDAPHADNTDTPHAGDTDNTGDARHSASVARKLVPIPMSDYKPKTRIDRVEITDTASKYNGVGRSSMGKNSIVKDSIVKDSIGKNSIGREDI